jgi:hypothetical protein
MIAIISRLFDNYSTAQQAVRDLETAGVPHSEISIVASNAEGWYTADHGTPAGRVVTPDRSGCENWRSGWKNTRGAGRTKECAPREQENRQFQTAGFQPISGWR